MSRDAILRLIVTILTVFAVVLPILSEALLLAMRLVLAELEDTSGAAIIQGLITSGRILWVLVLVLLVIALGIQRIASGDNSTVERGP